MGYFFEIYLDNALQWRWRLKAPNGQIFAVSGEGYTSKQNAQNGVDLVKLVAPNASVK